MQGKAFSKRSPGDFLKKVDWNCLGGKVLHMAADNLSVHKTKEVQEYFNSAAERWKVEVQFLS
jgi:hypothetical protein